VSARHWALIALYKLLVWAALHGGIVEAGYAPHYAPGLMAQVARTRDMAPAVCMVSRPRGPIGGWVWVYGERTGALLRCKVVDVSAPKDRARHERTGRVVEISHENARALCGTTRGNVEECPVIVIEGG
jgi:hypothetical protein